MASPTVHQEQGEWLPKAEAATLLGVSTREIERKAAAGRIRTLKVRLPEDRSDRTVYSTEDVQRLKQSRDAGMMQLSPRGSVAPVSELPAVAALAAVILKSVRPAVEKAWLTLEEAVAHSGLPASQIERLIRDGVVYATGRGHRTWCVQRASLDHYGSRLDHERS